MTEGYSPELEAGLRELTAGEREVIALRVVLDLDAGTAASVLPWRATARKYLTSSHSNMGQLCTFAQRPGKLAAARLVNAPVIDPSPPESRASQRASARGARQ